MWSSEETQRDAGEIQQGQQESIHLRMVDELRVPFAVSGPPPRLHHLKGRESGGPSARGSGLPLTRFSVDLGAHSWALHRCARPRNWVTGPFTLKYIWMQSSLTSRCPICVRTETPRGWEASSPWTTHQGPRFPIPVKTRRSGSPVAVSLGALGLITFRACSAHKTNRSGLKLSVGSNSDLPRLADLINW